MSPETPSSSDPNTDDASTLAQPQLVESGPATRGPTDAWRPLTWWKSLSQANKVAVTVPLIAVILGGLIPGAISGLSDIDPLELVDVTVNDFDQEESAAIVDVKLRSPTDQVVFAKRAEIRVTDARGIDFCPLPRPQPATYSYDLALPATPASLPFSASTSISQSLRPGETDRFTLKLGSTGSKGEIGATVYRFTVRIYYNKGDQTFTESDPVLAHVSYPTEPAAMTVSDSPRFRRCIKTNADNLAHLTNLSGFRSEGLTELANEYRESAAQFPI